MRHILSLSLSHRLHLLPKRIICSEKNSNQSPPPFLSALFVATHTPFFSGCSPPLPYLSQVYLSVLFNHGWQSSFLRAVTFKTSVQASLFDLFSLHTDTAYFNTVSSKTFHSSSKSANFLSFCINYIYRILSLEESLYIFSSTS